MLPALLLVLLPLAQALPSISQQGRYLYADGARISFKGVAYQEPGQVAAQTAQNEANGGFPEPSSYTDPLSNQTQCEADLPNLKQLGVNAIRVYNINPHEDHSGCMKAFNNASIYVIADLALPLNGSINRAAPSWDVGLLDAYIATIDSLRSYDNIAAFVIGNEVVTGPSNTNAAPFVKAAARDVKSYLASVSSSILTMYASTDGDDDWRQPLANYLACNNSATSVDIYGLNNYRPAASYPALTSDYANYPIPAVLSEFGSIDVLPRNFSEVQQLFSSSETDVWSGGFAFEYFEDSQGYGLTSNATSPPTFNADGQALESQYAAVTLPSTPTQSDSPAATYSACASPNSNFVASNTLPPTPNAGLCSCLMSNVFTCVVNPGTTPAIRGELLDYTCQTLAANGGSCDEIAANGATGVYGPYSYCSAETKLSAAFSLFYANQNYTAAACNFAGNATVNSVAPTATDASASAASSCASSNPTATLSSSGSVQSGNAQQAATGAKKDAKDTSSAQKMVPLASAVLLVLGALLLG